MATASVTRGDITAAVEGLGLARRAVCMHSSLRSFGHVAGGADAVIDGILDAGCTLMVPAHAWSAYAVRPGQTQWWSRNGAHSAFLPARGHNAASVFTPKSTIIDKSMGAIPATVVRRPERVRGDHALMSFAAVGPSAGLLVAGQRPDAVFDPVQRLMDMDGAFMLAGVGLERLTMLHYGEQLAGRRPFVRWANGPDGKPIEFEAGGCSGGFGRLWPAIEPHTAVVRIGPSRVAAGDAAAVVHAAREAIRADASATHCGEACARCDDAAAGGPVERLAMPR